MRDAKVSDGVSIAYDTFGDRGDPPVLLVVGFGAQMIGWHEEFCAMLAGRGRYVIRYDNRDCGLSTRVDDRAEALRILTTPTLVIHGLDDTLIDPSGGRRTAELVPGARLLLVPDMGHDRPRELWGDLVNAIEAHTRP
jgi:pimeloyl-ACP methyl ester carboxylesterase